MLFHSLQRVQTTKKFVVMYRNVSEANIRRLQAFGVELVPNLPHDIIMLSSDKDMEERDQKLMSKLRVWELVQYTKIVQMDSDMVVLRNIDELFRMPAVAACPMSDNDEKILFFQRAGPALSDFIRLDDKGPDLDLLPNWSGLNSGIVVLKPSREIFKEMMAELTLYPKRVCCPSQEFVYNFFDKRGEYFRLPMVYNVRRTRQQNDPRQSELLEKYAKVYHYVHHVKPWEMSPENRTLAFVSDWWSLSDDVNRILTEKGLGVAELPKWDDNKST